MIKDFEEDEENEVFFSVGRKKIREIIQEYDLDIT